MIEYVKICDKCGKRYNDDIEMQNFYHLYFDAIYGSKFPEGARIEMDICNSCLLDMIKPYCRINGDLEYFKKIKNKNIKQGDEDEPFKV